MAGALARTGGLRNADAEPRRRKGPVATEAAAGAMPPQVRAPGATGSWLGRGGPLPGASGGSTALPAPRRCRSGLPSSERINSSSVSRQLRGTSAPTVRRAPRPRGSSRPSAPTWSSLRASDAVLGAARGGRRTLPPGSRGSACLRRGRLVRGAGGTAVSPLWGPELLRDEHAHACVGACAGGFRPAWRLPPPTTGSCLAAPSFQGNDRLTWCRWPPPHASPQCGLSSGGSLRISAVLSPEHAPPVPRNIPAAAGCSYPAPRVRTRLPKAQNIRGTRLGEASARPPGPEGNMGPGAPSPASRASAQWARVDACRGLCLPLLDRAVHRVPAVCRAL